MAKRFTVVQVEDNELFYTGYLNPEELHKSEDFIETLLEYSVFDVVNIVVRHFLFTDYPTPIEDMTDEELDDLIEIFDKVVEDGYIWLEEEAEFQLPGLKEEDIIET